MDTRPEGHAAARRGSEKRGALSICQFLGRLVFELLDWRRARNNEGS